MSDDRLLVRVQSEPLSVDEALAAVADPAAGGTCVFVGTVRERSDAGDVTGLSYEAWEELAGQRLTEIARELVTRWPARRAAILHRTGDLAVGEASVVVAVSAPIEPRRSRHAATGSRSSSRTCPSGRRRR